MCQMLTDLKHEYGLYQVRQQQTESLGSKEEYDTL